MFHRAIPPIPKCFRRSHRGRRDESLFPSREFLPSSPVQKTGPINARLPNIAKTRESNPLENLRTAPRCGGEEGRCRGKSRGERERERPRELDDRKSHWWLVLSVQKPVAWLHYARGKSQSTSNELLS